MKHEENLLSASERMAERTRELYWTLVFNSKEKKSFYSIILHHTLELFKFPKFNYPSEDYCFRQDSFLQWEEKWKEVTKDFNPREAYILANQASFLFDVLCAVKRKEGI